MQLEDQQIEEQKLGQDINSEQEADTAQVLTPAQDRFYTDHFMDTFRNDLLGW